MLYSETRKLLIQAWNKTHNAKAVKQLLDSSGIKYLYLPSYSPDLKPIEKMWSKIKAC